MKTKKLLIYFTGSVVLFSLFFMANRKEEAEKSYTPYVITDFDTHGYAGAMEWLARRRVNFETGKIDAMDVIRTREQVMQFRKNKNLSDLSLNWAELGPDNQGGRTRAVLFDKDNPNIIYAGSVSAGLWVSTTGGSSWDQVEGSELLQILSISTICQATNGDIYAGTGEYFADSKGTPYNTGTIGGGIYKKKANETTFNRLPSTFENAPDTTYFKYVNQLVASPTDGSKIYAATQRGLKYTDDGGDTWKYMLTNKPGYNGSSVTSTDVAISSEGYLVAILGGSKVFVSDTISKDSLILVSVNEDDDGDGNGDGKISHGGDIKRVELAFSPDDPNYLYAIVAWEDPPVSGGFGRLKHVYKSVNRGFNWQVIGSWSNSFMPFSTSLDTRQGSYDMFIAVYPGNKDKVIIGGMLSLWLYEDGGWDAISTGGTNPTGGYYVHNDHHFCAFHPNYVNNDIYFIASDGGLSRHIPGGFFDANKKYITYQCYSIGYGPNGEVIAGAQDNGTWFIDGTGNTSQSGFEFSGSDGMNCFISNLNPNIVYSTSQSGGINRSDKGGKSGSESVYGKPTVWVTPLELWESFNDTYSTDTIIFVNDTVFDLTTGDTILHEYAPGEIIFVHSKINFLPIPYVVQGDTVKVNDTVKIQDTYQAMMALGVSGESSGVYLSRGVHDFSTDPQWNIITVGGNVYKVVFSKDGNYLYAIVGNNTVYRFSNLAHARKYTKDSVNYNTFQDSIKIQSLGSFSGVVTGIAVDPNDAGNVIVTIGGYGGANQVWYSTIADTTLSTTVSVNFKTKMGDLPKIPVHDAVIEKDDPRVVIIATEYGVYLTEDITASSVHWEDVTDEKMGHVPVYQIRQQIHDNGWILGGTVNSGVTNSGMIYIGTHGRGIFSCDFYKDPVSGIKPVFSSNDKKQDQLLVYPNPVNDNTRVSFTLTKAIPATVDVYNMQGKKIISDYIPVTSVGNNEHNLDVSDLRAGTYFVKMSAGSETRTSKIIVY